MARPKKTVVPTSAFKDPTVNPEVENGTEKITLAALKEAGKESSLFKIDPKLFEETEGELIAGRIILKLKAGEAAGPFLLKEILYAQDLNPPGKKKKMEPVDVYIASFDKRDISMPVAAAFVEKAKTARLSVGDKFLVKRTEDYISRAYGTPGAGYEIKIISRLVPLVAEPAVFTGGKKK